MKIGIITWHYYNNVGSNLQAYAMQKILKNLGHKPIFINYRYKIYKDSFLKKIIKNFCIKIDKFFPNLINEKMRFGAYRFQKEELNQTEEIYDKKKLEKIASKFDAVVCGSDQIWAPNVFDEVYMLSFVDQQIKKIAYAPSIGLNVIPENLIEKYKKYIRRIDNVSTREDNGVKLLKEYCDIEATQVLDPTLLIEKDEWLELTKGENSINEKYIFIYLLGEKEWIRNWIQEFSNNLKMKVILLSNFKNDKKYTDFHYKAVGPKKFIKLISEAQYVLTDSFHGMIFSILLKKQFYIFDRFNSDEKLCQNSRIISLLKLLELEDRRIKSNDKVKLLEKKIDYEKTDKSLKKEREKSLKFLLDSLSR